MPLKAKSVSTGTPPLALPHIAESSQSPHCWGEKSLLSLLEIEAQIVQPTVLSQYQLNYSPNVTLCQAVSSYCCFREVR